MPISALCLLIAASSQPADRTESPYFFINTPSAGADALPLKHTHAEVSVAGVIARVRVTQIYANASRTPLEAVYVFPGSTRSSVFGMRMMIGTRTIVAQIEKKEAARKIYENAKTQGKSAALLEQQRPNVFQMNVANIMPGDTVRVELDYTELLLPENGIYEFVYPTVVGPRYGENTRGAANEQWTENPYLTENIRAPYTWDASIHLAAGIGISKIFSPSHEVQIKFTGASSADIDVDEPNGGDRDFVLRYRLRGGEIQTGLLLYPGEEENFFLMMMQPPDRVDSNAMPPREYIFVVDVSGSMNGFALEAAKKLVREIARGLRSQDRFNLLLFAGANTVLSPKSLPANEANLRRAIEVLTHARASGSTNLGPALRRALELPREGGEDGISRTIVAITDGYVTAEREMFNLIRDNLHNSNVFAFGVGKAVNRHLIEGMARAGAGEPFIVLSAAEVEDKANAFKRYVASPVLAQVRIGFEGFEAYDVDPPKVPDLFADRPLLIFGKYKGRGSGRISVDGIGGNGLFTRSIAVDSATPDPKYSALAHLWARQKIARLGDAGAIGGRVDRAEITRLGLNYRLMTQYTSFVAVDSEVRNPTMTQVTVEQALPLPNKVGGRELAMKKGKTMGPVRPAVPQPELDNKGDVKQKALDPTNRFNLEIEMNDAPAIEPTTTPALKPAETRPITKATTAEATVAPSTASVGGGGGGSGSGSKDSAKQERGPRIIAEVIRVTGPLPKEEAERVIARAIAGVASCYDRESSGGASVPKRIYVELVINGEGRVENARVVSASATSELSSCIRASLMRLRFDRAARLRISLEVL